MGAVAQRLLPRMLAAAEEHLAVLFRLILHRLEVRALVRAIAEWLPRGLAAGAPEIGLALFHLDGEGGFLGDFRSVCHGWALSLAGCGLGRA